MRPSCARRDVLEENLLLDSYRAFPRCWPIGTNIDRTPRLATFHAARGALPEEDPSPMGSHWDRSGRSSDIYAPVLATIEARQFVDPVPLARKGNCDQLIGVGKVQDYCGRFSGAAGGFAPPVIDHQLTVDVNAEA